MSLPEPLDRLSEADLQALERTMEPVRFPAGAPIFRAGDLGDDCYVIDDGEVRLEIEHPDIDSDGVLTYLTPGSLLGELALLDRLPRSASAYAETDVAARRITAGAIDTLSQSHPGVALALVRALGRDAALKLRTTTERLAEYILAEGSDPMVDAIVERAWAAQRQIEDWPEDRIDALLERVAGAVAAHAEELAAAAVRETRLGNVRDKVLKNQFGSMIVLQSLVGKPASGPLPEDGGRQGVTEIASPVGVVFGIVPMTNPVSTVAFKTLICLKARNALILSFHHSAQQVGNATGEIVRAALEAGGAPGDLVQWVAQRNSRKTTARFMGHPGVALILATGGPSIVKAAYSSGTPALGVGAANTPAWVCPDADVQSTAVSIVAGKSFDNGVICGSEHNIVVDAAVRDRFVGALEAAGAAVLSADEARRFTAAVIDPQGHGLHREVLGQSADQIAAVVGIEREHPIRLIVVPAENDVDGPWAGEKLAPLLSLFTTQGEEEGLALCRGLLQREGTGHTAIIHTMNEGLIARFAREMPASRILVNSPGAQGVVGLCTGLDPSLTLGCGTFGGNSTTDNVSYRNLLNIKRLAYPMQVPTGDAAAGRGGL